MTNICYLNQVVLLIVIFPLKTSLQRRALILGKLLLLPTFMSVCQLLLEEMGHFAFQSGDFAWGDKSELLTQVRAKSYFLPLTEESGREGSGLTAYQCCIYRMSPEVNYIWLSWFGVRLFPLTYKRIMHCGRCFLTSSPLLCTWVDEKWFIGASSLISIFVVHPLCSGCLHFLLGAGAQSGVWERSSFSTWAS